jgi:hypothetical protein
MAGHTTQNTEFLTHTDLWSASLHKIAEDELFAQRYVNWLSEFPHGDTFNIPVTGQLEAKDYVENQDVTFTSLDTGNFEFSVTEYIEAGTYITDKEKQDAFYSSQLIAQFLPRMSRALMKRVEVDVLRVGNLGQTAGDPNEINGAAHRWIGTGVRGTQDHLMSFEDFARARLALQQAHMPMDNLIAIVDPSVEFTFNTLANVTSLITPNQKWGNIVNDTIGTGMQFKMNVYGFDVYVSHNLPRDLAETIYSEAGTGLVCNYFFSATAPWTPLVGAIRQPPRVETQRNINKQRDEFVTTMRYGVKLRQEDNFVTVLTDGAVATPTYA